MTYLRLCAAAALLSGCGLISSDVTNFDLALRDQAFSVDASGWELDASAADAFLSTSCQSTPQNVCTSAASTACSMNCSGWCGAQSTCELGLDVNVYRSIDLVTEQPELRTINDEPLIKVTVSSVVYAVTANTLNVETPAMKVYVAPMSVMDPNDPLAKQIGTIAAVPAGATVQPTAMTFTEHGKHELAAIMGTYKNPFNVIVGSQLVMAAGDPVPTGKLDAVVQIRATAGL
jgi:hypothetical protein